MRCPQCGTQLAPQTAICPACDHVVDASAFFSEPPNNRHDQDTPPEGTPVLRVPPRARATPPARKTAARKPAAPERQPEHPWDDDEITEPPRRTPAQPEDTDAGDASEKEADWHSKPAEPAPAPRPRAKASAREEIGIGYGAAEELAQEARFFLQELSGSDKAAFWGGALTAISCFFPWKQTALEGDTLGFMGVGIPALLFSLLLCGSIWTRERDWASRTTRANTWYLQFACAALIPLWTLVCIKLAWNPVLVRATVGISDIWTSKPGLGAIVALPCSVVALLGTFMGMKGRA